MSFGFLRLVNKSLKRLSTRFFVLRLATCLFMATIPLPCFAKPMTAPSLHEGVQSSQWIIIASFLDYKNPRPEPISYLGNVLARYKVIESLKGTEIKEKLLTVVYDFDDGSSCLPLQGWKFSPSIMPAKESKWILLLNKDDQAEVWKRSHNVDVFTTYRGDFGRMPATESNLEKIKALIQNTNK